MKRLLILAVLLAITSAATVSSECSASTTISELADLAQFTACSILNGSITLTGDNFTEIDWSALELVDDLVFSEMPLVTKISLPRLSVAQGTLGFLKLSALTAVNLSLLASVQELQLVSLPQLESVDFLLQKASSVVLEDTSVSSFSGLQELEKLETLSIKDNSQLLLIALPELSSVSERMTIKGNSPNVSVDLDGLNSTSYTVFVNIGNLKMSALLYVDVVLYIKDSSLTSLQLDSLSVVNGTLFISHNLDLTYMSVGNLTEVDGNVYVWNTSLQNVEFTSLKLVTGFFNIEGDFSNVTFPALGVIEGDFWISSTSANFLCGYTYDLHTYNHITGQKYGCEAPNDYLYFSASYASTSTSSGSQATSNAATSIYKQATFSSWSVPPIYVAFLVVGVCVSVM